ncbi:hypothetical protein [Neopusillimonas maritima]|uniref:Uncharacterized protein n=1 Tax=Neopusillimonas maritima TaxID=2026239 RepID=A0A3A1YV54_9BURK|nr:hypothetical protein [Neopusillimonas maritima]RIY40334.1 hypothetical protein CJP73_10710 [Neopusillimonas maritima]
MATTPISADYSAITTIGLPGAPCLNTVALFNCAYEEDSVSAIDVFIENCKEINKLWAAKTAISPEFGRLLLLGYVSAVESFFRTVFRSIINTDAKAQSDAHSYVVPYGAVLYHRKNTVAEALLEGYSFAGEKDVRSAFTKFLDVPNLPEPIKTMLIEYEKICQLRHCCVHRFGKLGTQNGIVLGLKLHSVALEKPLSLDKQKLGEIASWLMSFSKAMNNYMFHTLLERSVSEKNPYKHNWNWIYKKDRVTFEKLYNLFKTSKDANPSPSAKELYERFKAVMQR